MKRAALILGDIRFQFKYGFYFIYIVFSGFYIALLFAFPASWRATAGILMIYTDPAAMGLFFMGSIVLFEKSERVLDSLAVSPVRPWEYVASKLISIGLISVLVGLMIGGVSGVISDPLAFIVGIFLLSCICSAIGLIVATKITTLNQFMLATVPAEILINVPAVIRIFAYDEPWLLFHPGVSMIELCTGGRTWIAATASLVLWTVLTGWLACLSVRKMMRSLGGIKL
ncbi:MAG: ABC transporter permease [Oscillospiraceae bacterium]|nr:ABC transporter permease [Oscillospiraceae bacterium]